MITHYTFKYLNDDEYMPEEFEFAILYIGLSFGICGFLCPCGCGDKIYLRVSENEHHIKKVSNHPCWKLTPNTLSPSIQKVTGCKSHFHIQNSLVVWPPTE